MNLENYFLTTKRVQMILKIQEQQVINKTDLQEKLDTSSNYVWENCNKMQNYGLIEIKDNEESRSKEVQLTTKGEKTAQKLRQLYNTLKQS
jgi:Mn-dependent DtxR family transcriptional regulator